MRSRVFVVLLSLLAAGGCASSGSVPAPRSVLGARAPQTRSYEKANRRAVLTALVQGLQDVGFQIAQVDFEAGFVSANAERIEGRTAPGVLKALFWPYALAFPGLFGRRTHTVVEATGTVADESAAQRVRIVCRTKVLDEAGTVRRLQDVDDPKFYQDLFAQIDKALFLLREGL